MQCRNYKEVESDHKAVSTFLIPRLKHPDDSKSASHKRVA
jgi:hypothetical protein